MELFLVFFISYLVGSIPFGLIFAKLFADKDLRKTGSKNIGATNALRTGGIFIGIMTLLFDFAKGYFPVVMTTLFFDFNFNYYLFAGIACFIGHLYPVWLMFRGGKGVATFLGVLLAINMKIFFVTLLLMLAIALRTRFVSLASILGVSFSGLISYCYLDNAQAVTIIALAMLVIIRHQENIQKLLNNSENKLNF